MTGSKELNQASEIAVACHDDRPAEALFIEVSCRLQHKLSIAVALYLPVSVWESWFEDERVSQLLESPIQFLISMQVTNEDICGCHTVSLFQVSSEFSIINLKSFSLTASA